VRKIWTVSWLKSLAHVGNCIWRPIFGATSDMSATKLVRALKFLTALGWAHPSRKPLFAKRVVAQPLRAVSLHRRRETYQRA
jgi:hypothetical protein